MFAKPRFRLNNDTLAEFRRTTARLHDALILDIHYKMTDLTDLEIREIKILIWARDWSEKRSGKHILELTMHGVSSFILREPSGREPNRIVYGANIGVFDDGVYIDFFPVIDEPDKREGYDESKERTSVFQVICEECWVEVRED